MLSFDDPKFYNQLFSHLKKLALERFVERNEDDSKEFASLFPDSLKYPFLSLAFEIL